METATLPAPAARKMDGATDSLHSKGPLEKPTDAAKKPGPDHSSQPPLDQLENGSMPDALQYGTTEHDRAEEEKEAPTETIPGKKYRPTDETVPGANALAASLPPISRQKDGIASEKHAAETPADSSAAPKNQSNGDDGMIFTHALLLGAGETSLPDTPNRPRAAPANYSPERTRIIPKDPIFTKDKILNAMEMEVLWLGVESMFCLSADEFQFDFIYEYASEALKVEIRKLNRMASGEEKLKQIVRMGDWLIARRFRFLREQIRLNYDKGFRRKMMVPVIAELRLLPEGSSDGRHYPDLAPMK
jgi:hypothetical protein